MVVYTVNIWVTLFLTTFVILTDSQVFRCIEFLKYGPHV